MKIYFATHNAHKLKEVRQMMPDGIELLGLDDLNLHEEIPETADTIEGNSLMKTKYVFDKLQVACFADDTGLEVSALNGAPGVYSARYAGPEKNNDNNIELLLSNLKNSENRQAQFKTVITYIDEKGSSSQFTGIVRGEITKGKSGSQGFGYDPIFKPEGSEITFAEMSADEKNNISHRGRAFRQLIDFLNNQ